MLNTYMNTITKLEESYLLISKHFKMEHNLTKHLIAVSHVLNKKEVNIESIENVKRLIKDETSIFSNFRGTNLLTLSGLLSARSLNPTGEMKRIISHEKTFKSHGFKSSMYLPITIYTVVGLVEDYEVEELCIKAKKVYDDMKSNHPFLTSGDDYALAFLLAYQELDTTKIENYYQSLSNNKFGKGNGLQMLSHILMYSNLTVDETVQKTVSIQKQLKENSLKLTSEYFASLGLITLLSENNSELVNDVIEIATYLKGQKKYKWLGKGMNVMFATAIVASHYVEHSKDMITTSLSVSIESIIAAQQAAMIAAVAASSAAATSAN